MEDIRSAIPIGYHALNGFRSEGFGSSSHVLPSKYGRGSVQKSGENRIRTCEAVKQQIYSLPPLATWVSPLFQFTEPTGGFEPPTC